LASVRVATQCCTNSGAAYVFGRDQGGVDNWGQITKINVADGTPGDHFGNSVSIDGNTLIVGARPH
jgi:hypothetical protein